MALWLRVRVDRIDWNRETETGFFKGRLPKTIEVEVESQRNYSLEQVHEDAVIAASNKFGLEIINCKLRSIKVV